MGVDSANPLVSVIIPTYNHGHFIGEAIQSVLDQDYSNWEIIVVNNYSTDNTVEIVEGFKDNRIKLFNFSNQGVIAASRNFGIKNSSGSYVSMLDSDDIWFSEKIKRQIKIFQTYPEIKIVSANMETFPSGKKRYLKIYHDKILSFEKLIFLNENPIFNSTVMLKRDTFDILGFLDENIEIRAMEDFDYWLKILRNFKNSCYIISDPLIKYRVHSSNTSGAGFNFDFLKALEKYKIIYSKHLDLKEVNVPYALAKKARKCIKGDIKFKYYKDEIKFHDLFKNRKISYLDKIEILMKKIILKIKNG